MLPPYSSSDYYKLRGYLCYPSCYSSFLGPTDKEWQKPHNIIWSDTMLKKTQRWMFPISMSASQSVICLSDGELNFLYDMRPLHCLS